MKFISYIFQNKAHYGVLNLDKKIIIPMKDLFNLLKMDCPIDLLSFIQEYSSDLNKELKNISSHKDMVVISLDDVKVTAPIPYPRRNVFCLGKNYEDHVKEVKSLPGGDDNIPSNPVYFSKIADPAIGHLDNIIIPKDLTNKVDYEVELAVIIGKEGKDIPLEDVEDYIFGYTIANDVSARDLQKRHGQWFKGKSLDTFTPMGPYIVHKSEINFPVELDISCKVNGELRQNSNTKNLIFDISYIISDLSKGLTLRAGDIILTGTPAGVGLGFTPFKFLNPGDVVECSIENLGSLRNSIE